MKKAIALGLSSALILTLFAGCKAPEDTGSGSGSKKTTLKVAALESAYGADMWKQIKAAFEAENEGVTVELTIDKNLEDVISPDMKAGNYPDVIHLATGRPLALTETMTKDNALRDLSAILEMTVPGENVKVKDKILPGFLDSSLTKPYSDGKTYLMPMFYGPCGLFYNKANFTEGGGDLELPTTWDEFFALADKTDIPLFTYPVAGYLDAFTYAMMAEVGGQDFFNKALQYDEEVWSSPEMDQMFEVLGKLAANTNPATPSYANSDNFTKNQQMILDNEALFMPNGNWVIGEMADAPRAEGFEWGFMALPAMTDGGDRYSYTFFEQCWVPAGSENQDLAKVFISYLYSDEAAATFAEAGAVQPITGMTDKLSADNQVYYSVYDNGAKAAIGTFATTAPVEGVNIKQDVCFTMDSVVNGTKTVDDWKAAVQKSCAALRAAL